MILPIVTIPNPVLNQTAVPVGVFDDTLRAFVADMIETMQNAQGVGLAAPQVGKPVSLVVIGNEDTKADADRFPFQAFINPRITWHSTRKVPYPEGCLSIPGIEADIHRPDRIRVKAVNEYGEPFRVEASGLQARVLQHEIDHLKGILFTSYVPKKSWRTRDLVDYPTL